MLIINKPCGVLGTQLADIEKQKLNKKKVCICGKLDPMASGKLLLLFDNECKKMNDFLQKRKIYQWEILWGIETDTHDCMGIIQNETTITDIDEKKLLYIISKYIGSYNQNFHKYSAINVKNKNTGEKMPMWKWSMLNRLDEIIIPNKQVNVKYIKLLETKQINLNNIKDEIINNITKIKGNFRQDSIITQWKNYKNKKLFISKFEADVSSGFYVRELVNQIGNNSEYLGLALNINRIEIILD